MYIKLINKISPKKIASLLYPDMDIIDYDIENRYEWLCLQIDEHNLVLNITRDHGMVAVDDEILDAMTKDDIENIETAGLTHIFGLSLNKSNYENIPIELIQYISNITNSVIYVYNERIDIESSTHKPIRIIKPTA